MGKRFPTGVFSTTGRHVRALVIGIAVTGDDVGAGVGIIGLSGIGAGATGCGCSVVGGGAVTGVGTAGGIDTVGAAGGGVYPAAARSAIAARVRRLISACSSSIVMPAYGHPEMQWPFSSYSDSNGVYPSVRTAIRRLNGISLNVFGNDCDCNRLAAVAVDAASIRPPQINIFRMFIVPGIITHFFTDVVAFLCIISAKGIINDSI